VASVFNPFKRSTGPFGGAAFLMATSAIGPGFITQTTVFTQQLYTSFGFVILASILIDIAVQLNFWRIITVSGRRAQDIANQVLPGAGYLLAVLVALGGVAFNVGNVGGCGLGLNVLLGMDVTMAAVLSGIVALAIFLAKEFGRIMDAFTKIMGFLMIALTGYVAISSHPPVWQALHHTILPRQVSSQAILTLVGGTVGGYISFAGAHRLLDAGIAGESHVAQVTLGSIRAILLASLMRILLFLAALGVVAMGVNTGTDNPAAVVFQTAAGQAGYYMFGIVLWAAAITSVVGAAYTSVSFITGFHPLLQRHRHWLIVGFILLSTCLFAIIGRPVKVLVAVGALNGMILPLALSLLLVASVRTSLMQCYRHPRWLVAVGWVAAALTTFMAIHSIMDLFH
jgi:Mn2+/Fe2+ NRAMP family transporter